jgi:ferrous iron transport protein B
MIAAFIPHKYLLGFFSIQGLVLVSMYLLGFVMALLMGWLFKKTLLKGEAPAFIMELPPYKLPSLRSVLMQMWERGLMFLKKAGTLILGFSIVLWFLATYPRNATDTPAQRLEHSFVGQAGHFVEPLIRPLGFDWKIGVGIVSSVVQREVFVSTMGTLYNIKDSEGGTGTVSLTQRLQDDIDPATGLHTFGILTALSVMVYYVLALQCLSTFAVVKRETNGWKWPVFQLAYMSALAYVVTFIVYRGGLIFMRM